MNPSKISRRSLLVRGGAAVAGLALLQSPLSALAFPVRAGEEVIPWLDQPPPNPIPTVVTNLLDWQKLEDWVTPNKEFFGVGHYNWPVIDEKAWQLEIGGLVREERTFSLSDLKALPRKETTFTLECAGDNGFDWFTGGVGTARWAGTPLAPILEAAGVLDEGIEVVFTGTDEGEETVRDIKMKQNFAAQHVVGRRHEPRQPALLRDERRSVAASARLSAAPDRAGLVWHCQRQVAEAHRAAQYTPGESFHGA